MNAPDALPGVEALIPAGTTFVNDLVPHGSAVSGGGVSLTNARSGSVPAIRR